MSKYQNLISLTILVTTLSGCSFVHPKLHGAVAQSMCFKADGYTETVLHTKSGEYYRCKAKGIALRLNAFEMKNCEIISVDEK